MLKLVLFPDNLMLHDQEYYTDFDVMLTKHSIKLTAFNSDVHPLDFSKIAASQGYLPSEVLLITPNNIHIKSAMAAGISCLGYIKPSKHEHEHLDASYVAEGMDGIDVNFLNMVHDRFHHAPLTIGTTERLVIRELARSDLPSLYAPCCLNLREKLLSSYIDNQYGFYGYGIWGVFDKGSGNLIGKCGIELKERAGLTHPELGYFILPDERRNGYAFEAAAFTIKYTFETLGFDTLRLAVREDNTASIRLAEKLGMKLFTKVIPELPGFFLPYLVYTIGIHDF